MASQPLNNQHTTVFLKVDGELQQVSLSDVIYVEGMKDYGYFPPFRPPTDYAHDHEDGRRIVANQRFYACKPFVYCSFR